MDYIEITVSTTSLGADAVGEALMRLGAKGTQIIDRADVPDPDKPSATWELIDPSLIDAMPLDVQVRAWFPTAESLRGLEDALIKLKQSAGFDLGSLCVSQRGCKEEDWAECWKQYYKPFHITESLVVKPSWEEYTAKPGEKIMELDPGMAFGTGTHETTALCAGLIEKYYRGGRMLDVGTGSGILAIAAAMLGAKAVTAVDIDPVAVKVAKENVARNRLEGVIDVKQGDMVKGLNIPPCDFAAANILADAIIFLSKPLRAFLKDGAIFVCSGIILEREQDVLNALPTCGYALVESVHKGEWAALAFRAV